MLHPAANSHPEATHQWLLMGRLNNPWHASSCSHQAQPWLAQCLACNGDQVCNLCWNCPIPQGSISKAVQRVAATQAKVARTAAEEKAARALADVWDAIAKRKRNREKESFEMKDAEPKAKHPKQENRTETSKDGPEDVRGQRGDSDGRQRAVRATEGRGRSFSLSLSLSLSLSTRPPPIGGSAAPGR